MLIAQECDFSGLIVDAFPDGNDAVGVVALPAGSVFFSLAIKEHFLSVAFLTYSTHFFLISGRSYPLKSEANVVKVGAL